MCWKTIRMSAEVTTFGTYMCCFFLIRYFSVILCQLSISFNIQLYNHILNRLQNYLKKLLKGSWDIWLWKVFIVFFPQRNTFANQSSHMGNTSICDNLTTRCVCRKPHILLLTRICLLNSSIFVLIFGTLASIHKHICVNNRWCGFYKHILRLG